MYGFSLDKFISHVKEIASHIALLLNNGIKTHIYTVATFRSLSLSLSRSHLLLEARIGVSYTLLFTFQKKERKKQRKTQKMCNELRVKSDQAHFFSFLSLARFCSLRRCEMS